MAEKTLEEKLELCETYRLENVELRRNTDAGQSHAENDLNIAIVKAELTEDEAKEARGNFEIYGKATPGFSSPDDEL